MQINIKKYILPNLPYVMIGLYATKLGQMWRLAPGADFSAKVLGLMDGFAARARTMAALRCRFSLLGASFVEQRWKIEARGDKGRC